MGWWRWEEANGHLIAVLVPLARVVVLRDGGPETVGYVPLAYLSRLRERTPGIALNCGCWASVCPDCERVIATYVLHGCAHGDLWGRHAEVAVQGSDWWRVAERRLLKVNPGTRRR